MKISLLVLFCIFSLVLTVPVYGHAEQNEDVSQSSVSYILISSTISGALVLFSILYKNKSEELKLFLFLGISIPIIIATAQIVSSTVSLNMNSEAGGPVHWHADFEIWKCDKNLDLIEPNGFSNRVGTSVLHEHGDNRMHVEGVVTQKSEISLHRFFDAVGGELTEAMLAVPTNDGMVTADNGEQCPDGVQGNIQVFLYKVTNTEDAKNWKFVQRKLENYEDYVISPHSNVPPGDCLIIEFGGEVNRTKYMCESYELSIKRGELTGS